VAEKLTVAIVGAGQIAGGYDRHKLNDDGIYTHAGAYVKDGRFQLQTVVDLDIAKAQDFLQEWQVNSATACLEDIYQAYHDVISVCTPDATHYEIITDLIEKQSCRTIFAEKPLALRIDEINALACLAREQNVNLVINFQRQFDPVHAGIQQMLATRMDKLLAVNAFYMKGLEHNGITMIDTLIFLCGVPRAVYAFNRVFNQQVNAYTYEFILFYDTFNITVKTVDTESSVYNYHIFEIDLLLADGRVTLNDNSRQVVSRSIVAFAYSGVNVLNDQKPDHTPTEFKFSMLAAINYIHQITSGMKPHAINTPEMSSVNKIIVDRIILSFDKKTKIEIGDMSWIR